jgi:hypothetical protein
MPARWNRYEGMAAQVGITVEAQPLSTVPTPIPCRMTPHAWHPIDCT